MVKRDSGGDQMWVRAASTLLLGCMLHPGSRALQQGVDNFRQRKVDAEKFGRERGRVHWTLERVGAAGSEEQRGGEGLSEEEGGDDASTMGAGTEVVGMARSAEDGEERGERKGEGAGHFDSAPWMSAQREEAGGSNRRMMETIVVEALRNLWGNINEELLVYEERLEEVAQQGEEKRRRETGSHCVRANEDDLYRRGQGARLAEGAVRQMVPRGEEARMETSAKRERAKVQENKARSLRSADTLLQMGPFGWRCFVGGARVDAIRDAEVNKHMVNGLDGRYMSGEGTRMVDKWLRRSEEREEKAIQWSLEESNRRVKEERRQAKEDQSKEMEISESESSGCDEEVEMWRRVGHRTGRKKAKVDREARASDSGWGQGSQSVNQYLSQSVDQAVSNEQRGGVQMEVESSCESGAEGSSGQSGIDGAGSRSEMVGGEGYAEEDDALMMDYMENEGVGNEEIDRFMGWTTVDVGDERLRSAKPTSKEAGSREESREGQLSVGMLEQGCRQRRGNCVTSIPGRGIRRNNQVEVEGQIRIDGEDGSGDWRPSGTERMLCTLVPCIEPTVYLMQSFPTSLCLPLRARRPPPRAPARHPFCAATP